MAVQVFLSYARKDDNLPPGMQGDGFVATLVRNLEYRFQNSEGETPVIWRDQSNVRNNEMFDPRIEAAINNSDLFLCVLTKNWKESTYCAKELAAFAARWKHLSAQALKERIFVVLPRYMKEENWPPLMQGMNGYRFFHPADEHFSEREFFVDGETSRDFLGPIRALSNDLVSWTNSKPPPPPPSNGRKVYLAKPARDMIDAYNRVALELVNKGYIVAPGVETDIPNDATAREFVEQGLQGTEASIHLLGEGFGYAPEDCDPIAKLQLARAAAHALSEPAFKRIIWAPRLYGETTRDPFETLNRFDQQLERDEVKSLELSGFCESLLQILDELARPTAQGNGQPVNGETDDGGTVYVYCADIKEDRDYAHRVSKALYELGLDVSETTFLGEDRDALHRMQLRDCKSVVLCWSKATDTWVKSQTRLLKSPEQFGRSERFAVRSVVAGPPPDDMLDELKERFIDMPPRNEIDLVKDLRKKETPDPDDVRDIAERTQGCRPA